MRTSDMRPQSRTVQRRRSASRSTVSGRLEAGPDGGGLRVTERRPSELSVHLRQDLRRPSLSVTGDLDLTSVDLLTAMLAHARRTAHRRAGAASALEDVVVEVDLAAVTFADSHGLAPVLDSRTRIVDASPAVRRVLLLLT